MTYYDCYIGKIRFSDGCNPDSFVNNSSPGGDIGDVTFADIYNNLYDYCLADLVTRVNPWVECDLHQMGANIPNCNEMSDVLYRAGRPSCTSDFYNIWKPDENGELQLWQETAPCNRVELGYYCFNTYRYCWEEIPATNTKILKRILISSGAPSSYVCPPMYAIPDGGYDPNTGGSEVNCNAICGEN